MLAVGTPGIVGVLSTSDSQQPTCPRVLSTGNAQDVHGSLGYIPGRIPTVPYPTLIKFEKLWYPETPKRSGMRKKNIYIATGEKGIKKEEVLATRNCNLLKQTRGTILRAPMHRNPSRKGSTMETPTYTPDHGPQHVTISVESPEAPHEMPDGGRTQIIQLWRCYVDAVGASAHEVIGSHHPAVDDNGTVFFFRRNKSTDNK